MRTYFFNISMVLFLYSSSMTHFACIIMILPGIPLTNHENSTKNIVLPWVLKTWNDCRSSECQDLLSQFSLKTVQIIVSFYLNSSGSEIILIINCLACISVDQTVNQFLLICTFPFVCTAPSYLFA